MNLQGKGSFAGTACAGFAGDGKGKALVWAPLFSEGEVSVVALFSEVAAEGSVVRDSELFSLFFLSAAALSSCARRFPSWYPADSAKVIAERKARSGTSHFWPATERSFFRQF